MLQSPSASLLAKVCGGVLLLLVAGLAAYEILTEAVDGPKAAVLAEASAVTEEADLASGLPNSLAFGVDEDATGSGDSTREAGSGPGPDLVIVSPVDDSHHDTPIVVFEGETEPGVAVFTGPYDADVDADGHWRIELVLSPGANGAKISARDAAGNVTERSITVWLDVEQSDDKVEEPKEPNESQEPEKDEEPANVAFSANQQFGTCEEVIPYDVFWGTATPKSVVAITSSFGNAEVEVDKHGNWEKKVFFENAPRGDEFAVSVAGVNGSKTFEFLALPLPE